MSDLASDTAARADPEVAGRYHHALPDRWDYMLPSGGAVMTCALRAAEAHLAEPPLRLASATTIFASPIHPGALVSDVHVIRRGRSATQVRVALRHMQAPADEPGMELVATFMRDRRGPDVIGAAPPAWAKRLADSVPVDDGSPKNPHHRFRFYEQFECRLAAGAAFWQPDFVAGPSRYARWFRYRAPQRDPQGHLDRLALPPILDTMPTALHRAIGPGEYRFMAPSLDLTMYAVDDTSREWLLVACSVRRARAGWAIGDAEVWDDEGKLVAYGTQAMYLQNLSGDPPTVDASRRCD
ncbi:MAG TPA: thioesterase family protein [Kofleriaceae bacterium]|jgi:acyl-CoA thioesterase